LRAKGKAIAKQASHGTRTPQKTQSGIPRMNVRLSGSRWYPFQAQYVTV